MSSEILRKRYLKIIKESLEFLKEKGFKKKGNCYSKQKDELILEIYGLVPKSWLNSEDRYVFTICWSLMTTNENLLSLQIHMGKKKNLTIAHVVGLAIRPDNYNRGSMRLESKDPPEFDEDFITGVKEKINSEILPWFDTINSLDDIIHIAETELQQQRDQRKFFQHTNIYYTLTNLYASKGWKEKTLDMNALEIQNIPSTARHLAEKDRARYIQYLDYIRK